MLSGGHIEDRGILQPRAVPGTAVPAAAAAGRQAVGHAAAVALEPGLEQGTAAVAPAAAPVPGVGRGRLAAWCPCMGWSVRWQPSSS